MKQLSIPAIRISFGIYFHMVWDIEPFDVSSAESLLKATVRLAAIW
jgi:hypothetical protein